MPIDRVNYSFIIQNLKMDIPTHYILEMKSNLRLARLRIINVAVVVVKMMGGKESGVPMM